MPIKPLLIATFLLLCSAIFAQDRYKPSPYEIDRLPQWAQLMYAENPNVYEVRDAYESYYQSHPFEKSYHTQYYKKWNKQLADRIDADGYEIRVSLEDELAHIRASSQVSGNRAGNWSVLGPFVARFADGDTAAEQSNIYSIDQAPSNPSIWYCGSETGEVYKSFNEGVSWLNVSLGHVFGGGVRAIETDPTNPDVAYAGAGNFLHQTTDGGATWTVVLSAGGLRVNEILAISSDTVWVAADGGLFQSVDAGANWAQVFAERCYDIKANVLSNQILYVVKHNPAQDLAEFFLSTDGGQTFTQQTNGWHTSIDPARNDGGARLALSQADPNRIYAYLIGESKANDNGFIGVFRSDDGGYNWTLPNGPVGGPYDTDHINLAIGTPNWQYHQGFYNCAIMASHSNPDHILVGGLNLYKSEDGGATFFPLAGYVGGDYRMHVDMQDFRTIGNSTIVTTDGGIYHSTNFFETDSFRVKMNGIHASDYWGFGQGWNTDIFVGGLYHNGNLAYHENYGDGNFLQLGGGEPASGYVNQGENRKVYSSDINGRVLPLNIGDPVSSFGFGINPNESYWAVESSELEFLPACYNIAYTGFENDLWRTTDGGITFTEWAVFGTDSTHEITYIELSRSNPDVMYVCQQLSNSGRLWKTTDGGQNWNIIPLPSLNGNSRKMLIQLNPSNENELWVAFANGGNGTKIFKTTNGGLSWINLGSGSLNGENIHSIALIPNTQGGIYAFTNKGVWYRTDGIPWTDFSDGLPVEINTNIGKPFYRDGKIRLASYGRGVWESALEDEPTSPIAQITVNQLETTQHCETDTFKFVDLSIIKHAGATWEWEFPGGTPSSATGIEASVYYPSSGTYTAYLTVTDANSNVSRDSLEVTVNAYQAEAFVGEDFELNFPPAQFDIINPDKSFTWEQTSDAGGYGLSSQAAWFNNFSYNPGGEEDDLRIGVDFMNPSDAWLTFDVAYARYAVNYSDSLEVLISTDCGQTTQSVYFKGGEDLATVADLNTPFVPSPTEWRTDSIDLSTFVGTDEILIIFRNHSGWGNNTFLDNIKLAQTVISIDPDLPSVFDISVYPNPIKPEGILHINTQLPTRFELFDISGKKVFEQNQITDHIQLPCLKAGTYLYRLSNDKVWKRGKLVVGW